jgi:hypothetical protein
MSIVFLTVVLVVMLSTVNSFAQLRFDNSNNSSKGKGSPVTALKDAIDRGFLNDGHAIARDIAESIIPQGFLRVLDVGCLTC